MLCLVVGVIVWTVFPVGWALMILLTLYAFLHP